MVDAHTGPDASPGSLVRGVAELTLETSELEMLEAFYGDVLGLEVLDREHDRVWLALGGRTRLGLWCPGPKEYGDRGERHVHFALSAAPRQLEVISRRLCDAGVGVRGPVRHDGGDRSIYFRDPAGNLVEVWDFFERDPGRRHGVKALS